MDSFVRKHQKKINGTLSCFDRMIFRGYLPIQSGFAYSYAGRVRLANGSVPESEQNPFPTHKRLVCR